MVALVFFQGCSRCQIHSVIQPVSVDWWTQMMRPDLMVQCMTAQLSDPVLTLSWGLARKLPNCVGFVF